MTSHPVAISLVFCVHGVSQSRGSQLVKVRMVYARNTQTDFCYNGENVAAAKLQMEYQSPKYLHKEENDYA